MGEGWGGVKHLLFSHIPDIFALNILLKTGEKPTIL